MKNIIKLEVLLLLTLGISFTVQPLMGMQKMRTAVVGAFKNYKTSYTSRPTLTILGTIGASYVAFKVLDNQWKSWSDNFVNSSLNPYNHGLRERYQKTLPTALDKYKQYKKLVDERAASKVDPKMVDHAAEELFKKRRFADVSDIRTMRKNMQFFENLSDAVNGLNTHKSSLSYNASRTCPLWKSFEQDLDAITDQAVLLQKEDSLTTHNQQLTSEKELLTQENQTLKADNNGLSTVLDDLEKNIDTLQERKENLSEKNKFLVQENSRLNHQNNKYFEQINHIDERNQVLTEALAREIEQLKNQQRDDIYKTEDLTDKALNTVNLNQFITQNFENKNNNIELQKLVQQAEKFNSSTETSDEEETPVSTTSSENNSPKTSNNNSFYAKTGQKNNKNNNNNVPRGIPAKESKQQAQQKAIQNAWSMKLPKNGLGKI